MKRNIVTNISVYAYATMDLYATTHSAFHLGQMLGYINSLEAIGGRQARQLQGELKQVYNGWIDALNVEAA